jgi:phage shock protein A
MTESMLTRVKRIVSANFNEAIDQMEKSQAEIVMKEAIREIDRAVSDIRSEQGKSMAKARQAENQIGMTKKKIEELRGKIELALGEGREDLAKAAIARQIDFESQIPVLGAVISDDSAEQVKFAEYVAALSGRKREMEASLKSFAQARASAQENGAGADGNVHVMKRADQATETFNRAMQNATGLGAVNPAADELAAQLNELDKISHSKTIDERLAEAKAMRKQA